MYYLLYLQIKLVSCPSALMCSGNDGGYKHYGHIHDNRYVEGDVLIQNLNKEFRKTCSQIRNRITALGSR